jgi:mycothiol synthase
VTSAHQIDARSELTDEQQAQARALFEAANASDGVAPVSEHVMLRLRAGDGHGRHLLMRAPDPSNGPVGSDLLVGYAHVEDAPADDVDPRFPDRPLVDAELVVDPRHRGRGHGRDLLAAVTEEPRQLARIWSHGDHPAAQALARALSYRVVRTLLQLRRPLGPIDDIDEPEFPGGISLRSFRSGTDDAEWLKLNARAFAHHPEQGRMTHADLQDRMAESWFDPKGFLIAEKSGVMVGFHWTKVHPEGLGEVYVLGVDPDRHGGGLGRALTLAGLRYLAAKGLETVLLYVESDNAPALAVYQRLGFTAWSTDVMYAGPDRAPSEPAG